MVKRSRIIVIVVLVFVIIACYVLKLMQYQVTDGATYREKSTKSNVSTMTIMAARGEILDRYGRILATSKMSYNILIEKAFFPSSKYKQKQDQELLTLVGMLRGTGERWDDVLPISNTMPYKYTGSKYKVKALIKFLNSDRSKKEAVIPKNAPATTVMAELKKYYDTEGYTELQQRILCGILYSMDFEAFGYTNVYTFAEDIKKDTIIKIAERSSSLLGVIAQQVPERSYPDGTIAPHLIGMTGRINEKELAEYKSKGYTAEDSIGKFGIEQSMESYLRGTNGIEQIEQNSSGSITNTTVSTSAKAGDNVVLTIDDDLQKAVQNELPVVVSQIEASAYGDPRHGADVQGASAVVLDIKTGEVLAAANYPSFDLNSYRKNYSQLANDTRNPLLDRSVAGTYRPGSTFKPITATAGLMYGIVNANTTWVCPPAFTKYSDYEGHDDDDAWRTVNVKRALALSSNVFFNRLGDAVGMGRLESVATNIFGIGKKTGIELDDEAAGSMSGYAYDKAHGVAHHLADAAQAGIGQLDTKLTPLQMANYVSILCRSGTQYQVHVVKQINNYDNTKILVNNSTPTVKSKTYISPYVVNTVKEGMKDVTENGTASKVFLGFNMKLGGKTGTAQIGLLDSPNLRFNGVFVAFAPYSDPELAIGIVVEHGYYGYPTSPVAKTAVETYYGLDDNGYSRTYNVSTTQVGTLLQ